MVYNISNDIKYFSYAFPSERDASCRGFHRRQPRDRLHRLRRIRSLVLRGIEPRRLGFRWTQAVPGHEVWQAKNGGLMGGFTKKNWWKNEGWNQKPWVSDKAGAAIAEGQWWQRPLWSLPSDVSDRMVYGYYGGSSSFPVEVQILAYHISGEFRR